MYVEYFRRWFSHGGGLVQKSGEVPPQNFIGSSFYSQLGNILEPLTRTRFRLVVVVVVSAATFFSCHTHKHTLVHKYFRHFGPIKTINHWPTVRKENPCAHNPCHVCICLFFCQRSPADAASKRGRASIPPPTSSPVQSASHPARLLHQKSMPRSGRAAITQKL